jgi:23S rRNA (guanosine2251-2'-O)-methyltransferase
MEIKTSKIFGLRAVIEAVNSESSIDKVFIQKDISGHLMNELMTLLRVNSIAFSYVPVEKLDKLSKYNNHQGAVAQIAPINFHDLDTLVEATLEKEEVPLFLLLDQVSDVRNFGAIIRTAECTGVHGIVIQSQGNAPVNAETVKTSAGAAFNIPICKVSHLKDALFILQAAEIQVVAATEKTETSLYSVDLTKPTAIIMGSEDRGINPSILKMVDEIANLPLKGTIGSLNVSVACGAFLYEAVRQRM